MIRKDNNMSNTVLEKLKQSLLKLILSFQLYHSDERLYVFTLRAFVLGLISSFRLDFRKGIQSVISTWSILHERRSSPDVLVPAEKINHSLSWTLLLPKTNSYFKMC